MNQGLSDPCPSSTTSAHFGIKLYNCIVPIERITTHSEVNESGKMDQLKDRIQRSEELIKDLKEKLSASILDGSSKELKINEQNLQLEELRDMLVQKNEQIQLLEKHAEKAEEAFNQEKNKLKSAETSLHEIIVHASELRAEIQTKDNKIHDLQCQLKDANSEMVAKLQTIKNLELRGNDLEKKLPHLEDKIVDLENQMIAKDLTNKHLEEEKNQLSVKMKQFGILQEDSLQEKVLALDKASGDIETLANTINDLKDKNESLKKHFTNLANEIAQNAREKTHLTEKDRENSSDIEMTAIDDLENTIVLLSTESHQKDTLNIRDNCLFEHDTKDIKPFIKHEIKSQID